MLAVCLYIERRSNCGRDYRLERYRNLFRSFGVDHCYIVDRVDLPCFEPILDSYETVESFHDIDWKGSIVYIEKDSPPNRETILLSDFEHPAGDVLYVFGGDACGIQHAYPNADTEEPGDWVEIPTGSKYGLWQEHAAAIVLADRWNRADH